MVTYSTRQAAKMLGISGVALGHYIKVGKVPAPNVMRIGGRNVHAWSEEDIERLRKLLPRIANGRKTRYQKLREKQKAPAGVPVAHKKRRAKKKKII